MTGRRLAAFPWAVRLAAFPWVVRLLGLATIAAAAHLGQDRGAGIAAWLVGACAALSLLRVPRRALLLELAAADALGLALSSFPGRLAPSLTCPLGRAPLEAGPLEAAGLVLLDLRVLGVLTLLACLLAPERGLLRLNGLDRYFVAHDYRGFTPNFHHGLDLRQPLDRGALERAAFELHRQVPLARSFVREAFLAAERFESRAPWLSGADLVEWAGELTPDEEAARLDAPIPLGSRPPWRILVARRPGGGERLLLTIHHSLADGTGHFLLLERLLRLYEATSAGREPGAVAPLSQAPRLRRILRPRGLRWIASMVRRHVRPLDKVGVQNASLLEDETPRPSLTRFDRHGIRGPAWDALKGAASRRGRTPNDLLVAASLRAALAWRRARALTDRDFRLLLPMDLRPRLRVEPGLGNCVGVVRAVFTPAEVESPDLPALVSGRVIEAAFDVAAAIETPVNLGVLASLLPPWLFRLALRQFDGDPRSFFFSYVITTIRVPPLALPAGTEGLVGRGTAPRQPGFGLMVALEPEAATLGFFHLAANVSPAAVADYRARFEAALAGVEEAPPGTGPGQGTPLPGPAP